MERDTETLEVIELGTVTSETKGPVGVNGDLQLARDLPGLSDD